MKNLCVIFGGRSGEHEVSLVSAASVIKAVDRSKFNVVEVGIDLEGCFYTGEDCLKKFRGQNYADLKMLTLGTNPSAPGFYDEDGKFISVDLFFPVLHGPFGEDGTIQGLFEMLRVPYVGCGVLASSTAMDKLQCKALWRAAGLPVVDYVGFNRKAWQKDSDVIMADIETNIGFPCFVKPANMGSSVGITKAKDKDGLIEAIELAANYDNRILVEKAVDAREIECAILGNDDLLASTLGEIIVGGEFYDFHDKYVNGVSMTQVPADLEDVKAAEIQQICEKAYKVLNCSGLSRVDCFVDRGSGDIYLNELNTLPGFTSISMYSEMMEASGVAYPELIERLIVLAFERFEDRNKNQIIFDSKSEWFKE